MYPPSDQSRQFTEEDLREMVLRLAHEIRNPLATIKSAVQLLEHLYTPDGDVGQCYRDIHTEVERIDRVLRDMQCYVRLEPQAATRIEVADAVAAAVEAETSGNGRESAVVQVLGGPPSSVLTDPSQLEAALREFVSNALRFSPPRSLINVRWRHEGERMIAIEVDDAGPGIAREHESKIFRPFFSTSTRGTGLGLTIVSRVAQLAGGRVSWANLSSGGTRFTLVLPRV